MLTKTTDSAPILAPGPAAGSALDNRIVLRGEVSQTYQLRLAAGPADVRAAQRLRFEVFNLELQEGLARSYATGLDADPFDEVCDHLIVETLSDLKVVGTYRLQSGSTAAQRYGYYSALEFDLTPFEPFRRQTVELGRACVDSQHRNLAVLSLLWRGIATYASARGGRYLMGCSSITSLDPKVGATAFANLQRRHLAPLPWQTKPLPAFSCPLDQLTETPVPIPRLLTAYLTVGAKICGPPAIDREFKTIDFLTVHDLETLPPHLRRRYVG